MWIRVLVTMILKAALRTSALQSFNTFKAVFPRGVAGETVEVDPELHLLDGTCTLRFTLHALYTCLYLLLLLAAYVQEALASGAAPYSPPVEGTSDMFNYDGKESNAPEKPRKEHGLNFQPYQNPNERPPVSTASGVSAFASFKSCTLAVNPRANKTLGGS